MNALRVKKAILRGILILFGLISAMVITEIGLRFYYSDGSIPAAHLEGTSEERHSLFTEDSVCGYLPIVGVGEYGPHGCLPNDYDVEAPSGRRLLFSGDSVTHRGRIVKALKELYGEQDYEYWNAGVESFNTLQEATLYERHNAAIKPDHVILTFHNNDFRATPLVVREDGKFRVYQPGLDVNPWLFRKSYLYRWAWPKGEDLEQRAEDVRRGLRTFKEMTDQNGQKFTVVLHPMLKPMEEWDQREKWSRETSLAYFEEMGISYIDLLPALEQALAEGIEVTEAPGDVLHPNDEMARRFAVLLKDQGLLAGSKAGGE